MTSPAPSASARPIPATTPGRRLGAAAASAASVAVVAFAAATLAFFVSGGHRPEVFGQVSGHFGSAAFVVFVLLTVSNLVGALGRWFLAFISGLAAAVLAALVATTITVLPSAVAGFSPDLVAFVFGSIVSLNLILILTVVLAEVLLAPRVAAAIAGYRGARTTRKVALVRIPASNLADGELTHLERVPVDQAKADEQWDNYCAALVAEGWETVEVDAEPEMADSVFVEDTVVMFGDLAVLTSPGAESRRGEVVSMERAVRHLPGIDVVRIEQPGTLDGGDVLKIGNTVYVGSTARTNGEGIRQLRAILTPRGYRVVAVPVTKVLHLKSGVTALPDGTVIGHPDLVDDPSIYPGFLAVPEIHGVAVVQLSDDTLLMSSAAPKTAAMLTDLGYRVVAVDISEFEKLEGCVTCLSVRVR